MIAFIIIAPGLWNPEGVLFKLLRRELKEVICNQVEYQPDKNNDGKPDKA